MNKKTYPWKLKKILEKSWKNPGISYLEKSGNPGKGIHHALCCPCLQFHSFPIYVIHFAVICWYFITVRNSINILLISLVCTALVIIFLLGFSDDYCLFIPRTLLFFLWWYVNIYQPPKWGHVSVHMLILSISYL